jgi:hypothetical protein
VDTAGAIARNEALRASGRTILVTVERLPPPVPRRYQDELCDTAGPAPNGPSFHRQVEFQARVAVWNGFNSLDIPVTDGRGVSLFGGRGPPTVS